MKNFSTIQFLGKIFQNRPLPILAFLLLSFMGPNLHSLGQLVVRTPSDPGISLVSNATYTVRWSKGGTPFNRVRIKMSVDGGITYPYLLVNNTPSTATDTAENIVVPGIITTTARIRITNQNDSTVGDFSDNNFSITGFCWPWGMSCTNNFLREIRLSTLINTTNNCSARGYVNRAANGANTTSLYRGPSYNFTIKTSKTNPTMGVGIWCDLNGDSDFDDSGEFLFGSPTLDTTFTGSITIPNSALEGARRMRFRTVRNQLLNAGDACTFYSTGGEIEDYTVTIGAILAGGPLIVRNPNDPGITLNSNGTATATARWSKGGTIYNNVQIKLSVDGGSTFPYLLINNTSNTPTDTSENFVIPGIPTTQGRIRVANQNDSTEGDISDNDFIIAGYCWPWNTVCTNNFIRQVNINTLARISTCSQRGYVLVTGGGANTTTLFRGSDYNFTLKTSKNNNMGVGIWCDLNGDLDFEDAGEFLYGSPSADTTFTGTISLPVSASQGTKRLRIRAVQNQVLGAADACTFFGTGSEIEDYTITAGDILLGGPLEVVYPSAPGISLASTGTATATARWRKGGTTFNTVRIKLSTDGGSTFPYLLVNSTPNTPTDTAENFVIPGLPTSTAKIRVANVSDSTDFAVSENDFVITGYCWPWGMSCTNAYIREFSLNTLLRTSTCGNSRGYANITGGGANTTSLFMNNNYPFTLKTSKVSGQHGAAIWCDLNNDTDFDDPGELLYTSPSLDTTFNGSITLPDEQVIGTRRFRVRIVQGQLLTASDACTFFSNNGEIEDYSISLDIQPGVGPLVVRTPNNAGISLVNNSIYSVSWSKGGTTFSSVNIKLSIDGGITFPYTLATNVSNTNDINSTNITVPGLITTQARIRIANSLDSTENDISDNNFAITGYCWPWGMNCTNNSITSFSVNTLSRNSGCGNVRGYVNITPSGNNTTTMQRGLSYPFSISTNNNMGVGIWCDFNNDLDFDDSNEFLYGSPSLGNSFSGNITIPQFTATGTRRFRVRTVQGTLLTSSNACTPFSAGGEIEDYTITVSQPTITFDNTLVDVCPGTTISIPFTTTGTFLPGNVFTVQISLPGGNFGAGTSVIGTGTSSPLTAYIRLNQTPGSYRLRIVSSTPDPAVFGTPSNTFNVTNRPAAPTATGASRCGTGTLQLTASGCSDLRWYSAADQGTQLGTGSPFTTGNLGATANFFVACVDESGCSSLRTRVTATVFPNPTISDFSPTSGAVGFEEIVISGTNLANTDSVKFAGNKLALITSITATSVSVIVPIGATSGVITLFSRCGALSTVSSFTPIVPNIATPTFSPSGGTFPNSISVSLSCATAGASIYYTLNGIDPVPGNAITKLYTGPIFVGNGLTIKAIGFRNGWTQSPVAVANYNITSPTVVAKPTISPGTGSYTGGQVVSITCSTPQSVIYFTVNGQTPQPGVNQPIKYLGPITLIDPTVTVRAIGTRDGWANSAEDVAFLTITGGTQLSAPSFNPTPGVYPTPQTVTISAAGGASIFYTIDGTDPYQYFPLSKPYAGPVAINTTATLKAQAFQSGFMDSPRTVGIYSIGVVRSAVDNGQSPVYYAEPMGPANQKLDAENIDLSHSKGFRKPEFTTHPNPTTGDVFLNFGEITEGIQISVLNSMGKLVREMEVHENGSGAAFSLKGQKPGLYIIRIKDQSGNYNESKVILE